MIIIKKGNKELKVTNSSYKNFYKSAGWQIIGNVNKVEEESENWDEVLEEIEQKKPLSEMNRYELEQYASELGVSLAGLTTNKQIREAIKQVM